MTYGDVEEELRSITSKLQDYIENAVIPPQCEDLWLRKTKDSKYAIPMKCKFYCGHNDKCPYYDNANPYKAAHEIAGISW
jgi:hypothetical protein